MYVSICVCIYVCMYVCMYARTSCSSSSPLDRSVGSCELGADGREGNREGNLTLGDSCLAITKSNSGDRFNVSGS